MKRLLSIIFALFVVVAVAFFVKNHNKKENPNVLPATTVNVPPTPTPTPALKQSVVIDVKDVPIRVSWVIVDPKDVNLYSNLKDQRLSEQIKVGNSCSVLVNGGFYSKENTHLGLFLANFSLVASKIESPLLNGFLEINDDNILIGNSESIDSPRIALQSGPLLIRNGEALKLAINNDEPSRRVAAATTGNNKLMFLAFYQDANDYSGPMLGQVPEIIKLFEEKTKIKIIDAINLDGGSASVFITKYVRLVELAHIGSYFCVK